MGDGQPLRPGILVNIQALRFVASMAVVLHHAAAHFRVSGHEPGWLFWFGTQAGFAGVDVFFVISGFIMTWTTSADQGRPAAFDFLKRRVARIYSGYWPFWLLALLLFTWMGGRYLADVFYVRSFLLLPTALQHLLIPVSWTLVFEMGFYLLFAGLVLLAPERRAKGIVFLFFAMLAWALHTQFIRHGYAPGRLETMSVYEQYYAFPYLLEFLAGAWMADRAAVWTGGRRGWILVALGAALFVCAGWLNDARFDGRLIQGYFVVPRVMLFGTASVLIVAGLVRVEKAGVRLVPRISLLLGGASYALYLFHTLALAAGNHLGFDAWARTLQRPAAFAAYAALISAIVVYSVVHYRWLERPLHRLFRRLLRT